MRMIERTQLIVLGLALLLMGFAPADPPAIVEAARTGDRAALRALVAQGADVNAAYGDGSTALHWVSYANDLESAELLIGAGANVNATNDLGATPLWAAALNGSAPMTRALLAAGANPNITLLLGESVLMQASRTGNPEVVAMLLEAGANPNARGPIQETGSCPLPNVYEQQPFEPGVRHGLKPAELARIAGMRCGYQAGSQTALMWAANNRHPQVVALLLAHGADVKARSDVWTQLQGISPHPIFDNQRAFLHGGSTPLMFAARSGDVESAKLLVEAGADVNDTDAFGMTAVSLAAFANAGTVVRYLLEQGANPDIPPTDEVPAAIHSAIMHRDEATVAALLEHGADPNAPLRAWTPRVRGSEGPGRWYNFHPATVGASPLWMAARWGTPNMMRMLAEHGADPLVVHTARYYGGLEGIDAALLTQKTTLLMAALDMGGSGNPWVLPAGAVAGAGRGRGGGGRPEAEVLEAVKVAVELGVDVNAINEGSSTCDVPWARSYRAGLRGPACASALAAGRGAVVGPRTAIEAATNLGLQSVIDYLVEHGAIQQQSAPPAVGERRTRSDQ